MTNFIIQNNLYDILEIDRTTNGLSKFLSHIKDKQIYEYVII